MTFRLATSVAALSTALAAPAMADISAADVWANQQALYGAMGVTLSGEFEGMTLTSPQMNVILPQGVASLQITTGNVPFTENSDGTVTINYPSPMKLTIAGGAPGEGSFTATTVMTHEGYTITASGVPGDISYTSDAQGLRMEFNDITTDSGAVEEFDLAGFVEMEDWTGTSRVTEGNLVTFSSSSAVGLTEADFTFTADGVSAQSVQITQPITTSVEAAFPMGGSDVMNLSAALRNGLSVLLQSSGDGNSSETITLLDGEVLNTQSTTTGGQNFALSFTEDGLVMTGEGTDFAMLMNDPLVFPGNLEFGMDTISMAYDVPLNASEDAQDFRLATSLAGVTLGDTIWNLMDPTGQLPRDPAEITFDITGTGTSGIDLLNIPVMMQLMGPPPIEVDEVTIENLRIAAVGAEATATGSMTFDWTDFQTIPGVPRPEGAVTVNLNGANGLMDKLVAMGLIPEEDLMMPRMMMGMFATPVGDDMLETVLEVNDQGHVLANGQRLQ